MNTETIVLYTVITFVYILNPGPAIFVAMTHAVTKNMKVVALSAFASIVGLLLLSTIAMLGLGAILLSSATMFMVVKIVGAIYLFYMGIKQILRSRDSVPLEREPLEEDCRGYRDFFMESFFLAVTNPKPIVFFVVFFPQFVVTSQAIAPQFFTLTIIYMVISFSVQCGYGLAAKSAKGFLSKPSILQWFHRVTGGIFILMGLSLLRLKTNQS